MKPTTPNIFSQTANVRPTMRRSFSVKKTTSPTNAYEIHRKIIRAEKSRHCRRPETRPRLPLLRLFDPRKQHTENGTKRDKITVPIETQARGISHLQKSIWE